MNKIHLHEIRVKGTSKDYSVKFSEGLNIIAGEIYTGKSSILDLIDFCLGAKNPPQYPEIIRKGLTSLLEMSINDDTFTIERTLFSTKNKGYIHLCKIQEIKQDHEMIEVSSVQRRDGESISSFVLSKLDLWNVPLKESPTQDSTDIDNMSLRDLMWFCYLNRKRVAGADLLFESNHMKKIKLRQVFDVLFNLYSERLAKLCSEIREVEEKIHSKTQKAKILDEFANAEGIPDIEELEDDKEKLVEEIKTEKKRLREIDNEITGKSDIASELRGKVQGLQRKLQQTRVEKRNLEKTLQRLIPLRGQYAEDIRKLHFLKDARRIIDPLRISKCPVCLSNIRRNAENACPLCGEVLEDSSQDIDVAREIHTIERKLRELNNYAEELEENVRKFELEEKRLFTELKHQSNRLDQTLKTFVSPYLSEREELVSIISRNRNEIKHIDGFISVRKNIQKILEEKAKLEIKLHRLEKALEEEREKSIDQKELLESLSNIFKENLKTVKFPKLSEAYIDDKLVPYIRGREYSDLSSEGAINLASICWITSIAEESLLKETHHPGFLLLDTIQRGIGLGDNVEEEEFRDASIIKGIYKLLDNLTSLDNPCQIIAVDNHPPREVKENIVVNYTRNPDKPPYGFIDDEMET